jgi:hypothetical protein
MLKERSRERFDVYLGGWRLDVHVMTRSGDRQIYREEQLGTDESFDSATPAGLVLMLL